MSQTLTRPKLGKTSVKSYTVSLIIISILKGSKAELVATRCFPNYTTYMCIVNTIYCMPSSHHMANNNSCEQQFLTLVGG